MLEEPRLLLLRALDPLYPLEPPPNASRFPPPLRERSRLPMRSALPAPARSPRPELPGAIAERQMFAGAVADARTTAPIAKAGT